MPTTMWCAVNLKLLHQWMEVAVIIISVLEVFAIRCMDKILAFRQLKAENSKLRETLNKAYDFMKQFVVGGRNLLERFLESVGQVVEKVIVNGWKSQVISILKNVG